MQELVLDSQLLKIELFCEACDQKKEYDIQYKCSKCHKNVKDFHKPKNFKELIKKDYISGLCPEHGNAYLDLELVHPLEDQVFPCKKLIKNCTKCKSFVFKTKDSFNIMKCYGCEEHICWSCKFSSKEISEIYQHIKKEHPLKFFEHVKL